MLVYFEVASVITVQSGVGAEPYKTPAVFENAFHLIVGQSVCIIEMGKIERLRVEGMGEYSHKQYYECGSAHMVSGLTQQVYNKIKQILE